MDRSTLIFIFTIIVILIVFKIIKSSSGNQYSTLECNKKYTKKPGFKECPPKCSTIKPNKDCDDDNDDDDCKLTYSCVNRNIYREIY
jgi:hypothetical protein